MFSSNQDNWTRKKRRRQQKLENWERRQSGAGFNVSRRRVALFGAAIGAFAVLVFASVIFFDSSFLETIKAQTHRRKAVVGADGKTFVLKEGDDLQDALDKAKSGDTIILTAGAKFVGNFTLPAKNGGEFITVQSSQLDRISDDQRVSPQNADAMPKILSSGKGKSAIQTAARAHHFRFVGIEISVANDDYVYNLISLGADPQKAEDIAHHIEIDRCYIHSRGVGKTRRGVALNSAETVIKNSYIAGFAGEGDETQAVAGWNGTGKYIISNNYLEGGAENVLFGGSDPSIPNLVPSDIEVSRNYFSKPREWFGKVVIKNSFELKNARRVKVFGNVFEDCWDCAHLLLTVRNQEGKATWATVEDIEIFNNMFRRSYIGLKILGQDDNFPSQMMKRVKIYNNLFLDIDSKKHSTIGYNGYFLQIAEGENIEFSHNTIFQDGNAFQAYGAQPVKNFIFRANIVNHNETGIWGDEVGSTREAIAKYFPNSQIYDNLFINNLGRETRAINTPPRNFTAPNLANVGFEDAAKGNYRLRVSSPYRRRSVEGKDLGCNFETLSKAIEGVVP